MELVLKNCGTGSEAFGTSFEDCGTGSAACFMRNNLDDLGVLFPTIMLNFKLLIVLLCDIIGLLSDIYSSNLLF